MKQLQIQSKQLCMCLYTSPPKIKHHTHHHTEKTTLARKCYNATAWEKTFGKGTSDKELLPKGLGGRAPG